MCALVRVYSHATGCGPNNMFPFESEPDICCMQQNCKNAKKFNQLQSSIFGVKLRLYDGEIKPQMQHTCARGAKPSGMGAVSGNLSSLGSCYVKGGGVGQNVERII